MGKWSDIATWVGPTPNTSGSIADHMYVVIHIADGSYDGTISWQKSPSAQVSSHFIVAKDGRIAQMLDTTQKSWCQIEGNPYSIAVENEGFTGSPLTDAQLRSNGMILARAHKEHGIPLQLTGKVGTRGLGHHSMGAESGVNWGHSECPGNNIKTQKQQILNYANAFLNPGAFMALSDQQQQDMYEWVAGVFDPDGNPPTRSRFNWPALRVAHRFDNLDAALAAGAGAAPTQDQVDAAVKKALTDPAVVGGLVKAINDDMSARLAQ